MRARIWFSLAVIILAVPAGAAAHATLRSVGSPPGGGLALGFSAPVEDAFLSARGPNGVEYQTSLDPADDHTVLVQAPGRLALTWRVLSRDGHVTGGRFEATSPVVDSVRSWWRVAVSVLADVMILTALVGLLGVVAARVFVVAPAWREGGTRPPGGPATDDWQQLVEPSLRGGLTVWWRAWWALAIAAGVGLVLAVVGLLLELDSTDVAGLSRTRWGIAWMVQAVGLLGVAGLSVRQFRSPARSRPDAGSWWGYGTVGGLGVAAAAIAWAGHGSSGTDAMIGIGTDALHLLATGLWLGGLVTLLVIVPRTRRGLSVADATRFTSAVVVRFSALAILCVGTLVVTGVYRAIAELSAFSDLVDTGYGRALLIKLLVFGLLLTGGVFNRLVLHPRLERTALGLRDDDAGAGQALRISVTAELVVAGALVVVVGVLVNLPPP